MADLPVSQAGRGAAGTPLPPPSRTRSPAPLYRRTPVRVGCVQFDPKLGMVKENAAKVEGMLSGLSPGQVDLLVLPEMCLSGYMFQTPTSILPYLESPRIGPTSLLARSLAQRLRCHVIAGYPEALPSTLTDGEENSSEATPVAGPSRPSSAHPDITAPTLAPSYSTTHPHVTEAEETGPRSMKALDGEALGVGYNSAVVVGPEGEVVGNYRKTFRFETDKNWAREGDGFGYFDLPEPLGRVAVGICMDMNPKDFIAPWDAFELASFCGENKCDMLVVPMAWLDPPNEPPEVDIPRQDPSAPSVSNLNYWAARLTPLHDPTPGYGDALATSGPVDAPPPPSFDESNDRSRNAASTTGPSALEAEMRGMSVSTPDSTTAAPAPIPAPSGRGGKEVVFVACNRVGTEEGTKFVGTSCVMTISADPSRIELVECCNVTEERVLVATIA